MLEKNKLSSRFSQIKKTNSPKKLVLKRAVPLDNKISDNLDNLEKQEIPPKIEEISCYSLELEYELKQELTDKIESTPVWSEYSKEKQKELIKNFVEKKLSDNNVVGVDSLEISEKLLLSISGFGVLENLIKNENVSSIYVNGTNPVFIDISGKILNTEIILEEVQLKLILNNIYSMDLCYEAEEIKVFKAEDLIITVITPRIALSGASIVIKKIQEVDVSSMMTDEIFDFLISVVNAKKNVVISGNVNSGKTSLLNSIIKKAFQERRIAIIEEIPELRDLGKNFLIYRISKKSDEFEQLVSNIVKMMPDYMFSDINSLIIPEIRGCISTLRASSVDSALSKLTSAYVKKYGLSEKYARSRVLSDIDYIVQLNITDDGKRILSSLIELSNAKTAALSVKTIAKYSNGRYTTNIPQPLTSTRANSLASRSEDSISSRFYQD